MSRKTPESIERGTTRNRDELFRRWWRRDWVCGLALVVAVFLAYMRVRHAGFIWDDDDHLTKNPCITGPLGFKAIWTSSAAVYYPLVLTTFRLLHALWGLNPALFHLFNVAMHAACAVLLWRVLLKLRVRGAWLGAALWALHPVMVESVAWITELKNTQSCLFYLMSILCYLDVQPAEMKLHSNRWRYGLALLFFVMAVTSKSSTVMLPVVLALCTWWQEERLVLRGARKLAPFFLVSALAGIWTVWEQKFHSGALGAEWTQTWPQRIIIAGRDVWFYLGKLAWPHPLVFIYPRWETDASQPAAYLPALAAIGALFALWRYRNGRARPLFFATVYFVVSLFPVLDFFNVYFFRYSFVSDHFQYLASIGPLALLAAGITAAPEIFKIEKSFLLPALCGILLAVLGILSWRQSAMYSDNDTLYAATIEENPDCWMARSNLGYDLLHNGQVDAAIGQYQQALKVMSDLPETHYNLGLAFEQKGRMADAIDEFQKALDLKPDYAEAHYDLGLALQETGQPDQAIAHYQKALEIAPDMPDAHLNLGNIFGQEGNMKEAIAQFQRVLEIEPDYAKAHYDLGFAFQEMGQANEAISQYKTALEIQPDYLAALSNMAYVLAACPQASLRDGAKALELAQQASHASDDMDPLVLRTLAAAYAETGEFSKAVEIAQRALDLATSQSNKELMGELQSQIMLYRANTPFRDARLGK